VELKDLLRRFHRVEGLVPPEAGRKAEAQRELAAHLPWLSDNELMAFEAEIRAGIAAGNDEALIETYHFWSRLARRRREAREPPRV
jgi:hypothetical protein